MRTLLAVILASLPLLQAQDSRLLKSVEPNYAKYSEELAADFENASTPVRISVLANGKPFALDKYNVPLPMAVVMALRDYEFQPQSAVSHGRPETEAGTYQVTLNVPIRQSKDSVQRNRSAIRVNPNIARGLLVKQVRPEYSEYARHNRIQGPVTLEAIINKQGEIGSLKIINGPFVLIEAACDAVKQWQWRPYILNDEPVELLTEIQVAFD